MKDYNEMANSVFRRRDEFVAMGKKRKGILIKAGTSVCALLLVAVIGVSVWRALPHIPSVKPTEPETTVSADTTEDTAQTQEADTTKTKPAVDETQEKTEGVQAGNTQNTVLPYDPVESTPAGNTDKPQTETTLPADPTEPKNDTPQTGETPDPTSAGSTDSNKPTLPTMTSDAIPPEPTTAVEGTLATLPDEPTEPTMGDFPEDTEPTEPTMGDLPEDTEPTEPVTGPLFIECDGKTYEAQTGDMVTLTVELQADEPIEYASIRVKYDYYYDKLQVVDLRELGFTDKQRKVLHMPGFERVPVSIDYYDGNYGKGYKAVKVNFGVVNDEESLDFTEKKVLFTFSFMVTNPGDTKIELVPGTVKSVNGTDYVQGRQLVEEGIDFDMYLDIVPQAQVQLPIPPEEEVTKPAEDGDFTYPAENTDGDLVINCQGRKYSANVGDVITYTFELDAERLVGGIQLTFDYGDGELELIVPQPEEGSKAKIWFPNLYGLSYNYQSWQVVDNYQVKMNAVDVMGFDFEDRKIVMTFDFIVKKSGIITLKHGMEEMYGLETKDSFFYLGEQVNFEDIEIYEYVTTKEKYNTAS